MREIKFRAWDKKLKEWADTEYYHLVSFDGCCYFYSMGQLKKYPEAELMQYTGLNDKNGKEIYEGDIIRCVRYHNPVGIVEFDEDKCRFRNTSNYEMVGSRLWEVIGNIYENPELLTK